ncbi:MAG: hotdog domain-containing protein [Myxococcota bacterium]|nr:hotdog domain-containing protein [Myxococcota bacterium]
MSFQITCRARFNHVDRAGIAFFARAYEYAHACFEEMLEAAFGAFDTAFHTMGVIMPLVHSEASYARPIRQGDRLLVSASLEKVSTRSVTFAYDISTVDGVHKAQVFLKHAFVDPERYTSVDRPSVFDEAMLQLGLAD